MTTRRTAAECIAFLIGWDYAEMSDCRYQPSRYKVAVYVIGNDYMCCPAVGVSPPARGEFKWVPYGTAYGRTVFKSTVEVVK